MFQCLSHLSKTLLQSPVKFQSISPSITRFSSSVTNAVPSSSQDNEPDELYSKIGLELQGNDPAVLKSYSYFAQTAATELGIGIGKCWSPPKHHERFTMLKSVHVHKKAKVQYEYRTYFHNMEFLKLTGSTKDTFLEYIERNLPEGVLMIVTKHKLETLPSSIKLKESDASVKVLPSE